MTYEIFGLPRGWSRQRRDLFPVAALVLAGIGAACAPGKVIVPGQTCATDKDCAAGALCLDRVCTKPCVANTDCPNGNEACTEGRCQVVPDAECIVGGDCVAPLPCFTTQGVTCVAGRCGYPPESQGTPCDDGNPCTDPDTCSATHVCGGPARLCNQPDPPFCVDDVDGPYRYYEPIGTCNDTTGDCEYTPVDQPCANCAETCLQRCAGMFCNDLSGGCRLGGVCVPDDPAWCLYTIAPDGIMCDLPQSPLGSNDGICSGDMCDAGVCTYTVQPISECMPSGCAGNVETLARVCGADGACADKGTVSCNGLRCDSANLHCLTSGTSDSDCLEGLYFKTDGTCAPIINDGGSCVGQGDHACASGHCNGSLCCAVGADCCNVPSDCPASYTVLSSCNDNSTATDCQGTAEIPTCIGNVCGKQVDDDDRGCVSCRPRALRGVPSQPTAHSDIPVNRRTASYLWGQVKAARALVRARALPPSNARTGSVAAPPAQAPAAIRASLHHPVCAVWPATRRRLRRIRASRPAMTTPPPAAPTRRRRRVSATNVSASSQGEVHV